MQPVYRPHNVVQVIREDGSILLRSTDPLTPSVRRTTDWLRMWANDTPDAIFLGERSGEAWRELSYCEVLEQTIAVATSLIGRGLNADTPIMIISGNSIDHAILTFAAHMIGVPIVPVAEQYALIPAAHGQLGHIINLTRPAMVYAEDGCKFASALALPGLAKTEVVVAQNASDGATSWDSLLSGDDPSELSCREAMVGPDTLAKILMTSGSTSLPKGVLTTHQMMCSNQSMIADALPFLRAKPPRLVDWLPWNHVFGGSHNVNLVLANGGSLHIDSGKPVRPLIDQTIANLQEKSATIAFNVPVGFALLRDTLRADADLREAYFRDLDMLFYAGASLPQDVWADLHDMAISVCGHAPLFTSSWGLTETAPAVLLQHELTHRSGIVGVPLPGTEVKLRPLDDDRFEIRAKGPNIFSGYWRDPVKTADAFDEEGFFISGDAMRFVLPGDPAQGLAFDGRLSEDFKLNTGTWVRAATLRLELLVELSGLAADVVICGADRDQVGLFILPTPQARSLADQKTHDALHGLRLETAVRDCLAPRLAKGSAARICRVRVLDEPASLADGEITAKGNLNFQQFLKRRSASVELLYSDDRATCVI
jgi:feruloyl-CoA synthase